MRGPVISVARVTQYVKELLVLLRQYPPGGDFIDSATFSNIEHCTSTFVHDFVFHTIILIYVQGTQVLHVKTLSGA